jgi:hypothetical protein
MSRSNPNVYWQDVARVRCAHPDWSYPRIGIELNCRTEYVRATFQRKHWPKPQQHSDETKAMGDRAP